MTRHEFVNLIDLGNDIMFDSGDKSFTIISVTDGINIAEQITEKNEDVFNDGNSLLKNYLIDGVSLTDCFDQIVITHCT